MQRKRARFGSQGKRSYFDLMAFHRTSCRSPGHIYTRLPGNKSLHSHRVPLAWNFSGSPNLVHRLMYSSQFLVASLFCVCGGRLQSFRNFVSIRNLAPRRHWKTEDTLWLGDVISQPKFYLLPPPCISLPCLSISPMRLEHGLHLKIRERKQPRG